MTMVLLVVVTIPIATMMTVVVIFFPSVQCDFLLTVLLPVSLLLIVTVRGRDRVHEECDWDVAEILERLEDLDDAAHCGPLLGLVAQAPVRQRGRLLGAGLRVLPLESRVHDPAQLPRVVQHRPRPLHQVLFPARTGLVHRFSSRQEFKQYHSETVHVASRCKVPWKRKSVRIQNSRSL